MKIAPNFMKSLEGKYRKASMMNTLKENLETRQARADDYFSDLYGTAESKGLPAYEEATLRAKDLKRIGTMLQDNYSLSEAEVIALAQRPSGLYGSGLVGIEKAITNANEQGKPLTRNEILGVIQTTDISLPEGMSYDDAISQLAGIYVNKAKNDPNAKDEKNTFMNLLSSALTLNPRLEATNLLQNANIGGLNAQDLLAQASTIPKQRIEGFDIDYSKATLGRRSAIQDQRLQKRFQLFVNSLEEGLQFDMTDNLISGSDAMKSIYGYIPDVIFRLEGQYGFSEYKAEQFLKERLDELLKRTDDPESIATVANRVRDYVQGNNEALNKDYKPKVEVKYAQLQFSIKSEEGKSLAFTVTPRHQQDMPEIQEKAQDLRVISQDPTQQDLWEKIQRSIAKDLEEKDTSKLTADEINEILNMALRVK